MNSLLRIEFTASVKKSSHQVSGPLFLHFLIKICSKIDVSSISGSFEYLTTNQWHPFYRSYSASGGNSFQSSSKYHKYDKCAKIFFKILLAANIVHSKDYQITWNYSQDFKISNYFNSLLARHRTLI